MFTAASYKGTFKSIVPATPGEGLSWDTTMLRSKGIIKVDTITISKTNELLSSVPELTLYPNPVKDNITITLSQEITNVNISLENLNGQRVFVTLKNRLLSEIIDVSQFPSGIYILKIQGENKILVKKILKE